MATCAGIAPPPIILANPLQRNASGRIVGSPASATNSSDGVNYIMLDPNTPLSEMNFGTIAHELGHLAFDHFSDENAILAHNDLNVVRQHEIDADKFAAKLGYGKEYIAELSGMLETARNSLGMTPDQFAKFQADIDMTHPPLAVRVAAVEEVLSSSPSPTQCTLTRTQSPSVRN